MDLAELRCINIVIQILLISKEVTAAVEEIWGYLSSILFEFSLKLFCFVKDTYLGSCREDLEVTDLSSIQILFQILLPSKGCQSRQL